MDIRAKRFLVRVGVAGVIIWMFGVAWFAFHKEFSWTPSELHAGNRRVPWEIFSKERVEAELAGGQIVLLDVFGRWNPECITHQRLALEQATVRRLIYRHRVVALRADWTEYEADDEIAQELERLNEVSVPLVVIYSPNQQPIKFGSDRAITEIAVIAGLEEAAKLRSKRSSRFPQ